MVIKDSKKKDKVEGVSDILLNAFKNSYQKLTQSNNKIKQLESELDIKGD